MNIEEILKQVLDFAEEYFQAKKKDLCFEFSDFNLICSRMENDNTLLQAQIKKVFLEMPSDMEWRESIDYLLLRVKHLGSRLPRTRQSQETMEKLKTLLENA